MSEICVVAVPDNKAMTFASSFDILLDRIKQDPSSVSVARYIPYAYMFDENTKHANLQDLCDQVIERMNGNRNAVVPMYDTDPYDKSRFRLYRAIMVSTDKPFTYMLTNEQLDIIVATDIDELETQMHDRNNDITENINVPEAIDIKSRAEAYRHDLEYGQEKVAPVVSDIPFMIPDVGRNMLTVIDNERLSKTNEIISV